MYNSSIYLTYWEGGMQCNGNGTVYNPGVCGGFGSYLNDKEMEDGLDVGRDYCLSGEFSLHLQGKKHDDLCICLLQEEYSETNMGGTNARMVRRWRLQTHQRPMPRKGSLLEFRRRVLLLSWSLLHLYFGGNIDRYL